MLLTNILDERVSVVIGLRGITENSKVGEALPEAKGVAFYRNTQLEQECGYCGGHGIDEAASFCVVGTSGVVTVRLSRVDVMTGKPSLRNLEGTQHVQVTVGGIGTYLSNFIQSFRK